MIGANRERKILPNLSQIQKGTCQRPGFEGAPMVRGSDDTYRKAFKRRREFGSSCDSEGLENPGRSRRVALRLGLATRARIAP